MQVLVRDYMSRNVIQFLPDTEVLEAVGVLIENNISGGPVIDRLGNLLGMLSETDCLEAAMQAGYHGSRGGKVRDFMSTEFETVDIEDSIMDIARLFCRGGEFYYRGMPVMKSNRVVGNLSLHDVLKALQDMALEDR
jgi:CBS domain-containing protein